MTTNSPLTFEHDYDIRSYEPRADGRISITSVCNHLQDIASRHADSLGFGFHDLELSGHFWVLARMHIMMERLPVFGETLRIETWPSGNERLVANRDYLIQDETGIIGRATSSWVTMNAKTHTPDKPDEVLHRRFIPERERALVFPTKAVTRLKKGTHETSLTARRSDLDINNHVNNVHYTEFCLESVPQDWDDEYRCQGLDIQFRQESFAGDEYTAACITAEPDNGMGTLIHSLTRKADSSEIVRMRTWWSKR